MRTIGGVGLLCRIESTQARWHDDRRGKGKRGGLRVIYYWLINDRQIWMFSIYDKDEVSNLTADHQRYLKAAIDAELRKRGKR
jgi:hypothetical protein